MPKWKTVRIRQELVAAAKGTFETTRYQSLSEFVSEAIRLRLDELKQSRETIAEKQVLRPVIQERLLYTQDHMWAMVTPEGNIRVGLSRYAQEHLKGIADVQTYPIGYEVKKGEPFGVVETWMFMFDLHSPVSGIIAQVNNLLLDEPSTINGDPLEITWIAEIKPNSLVTLEEELRDLMNPPRYRMWMSKQSAPRILGL